MFQDPDVDAVIIAAPAGSHAEIVVAAAKAGKVIFCENHMAVTLEEADKAIGKQMFHYRLDLIDGFPQVYMETLKQSLMANLLMYLKT